MVEYAQVNGIWDERHGNKEWSIGYKSPSAGRQMVYWRKLKNVT